MNFCFKWRHRDGSIVEFSANGWFSDDASIADWLSKMNQLYGSAPGISPAIRNWLQEECELIDVGALGSTSDQHTRVRAFRVGVMAADTSSHEMYVMPRFLVPAL